MSRFVLLVALAGVGCSCRPVGLSALTGELQVAPEALTFDRTYVGYTTTLEANVTNSSRASLRVDVRVTGPFRVDSSSRVLASGETQAIGVHFEPTEAGDFVSTLELNDAVVTLFGLGLEVPKCEVLAGPCEATSFDVGAEACTSTPRPEGTACSTRCIVGGACSEGACRGQFNRCDDGDACTVDACDEATGCSLPIPVVCPAPPNECQVAVCHRQSGCALEPVEDGTPCGDADPDSCVARAVDVCLAGQCVARPRPSSARCNGRWFAPVLMPRSGHDMAYDPSSRQVLLFGGSNTKSLRDTWQWNGVAWAQRFSATSPRWSYGAELATDVARQRIVLLEQGQPGATWEWNGRAWASAAVGSPFGAYASPTMAYDPLAQRVVAFHRTSLFSWSGHSWDPHSTLSPPAGARFFPGLVGDAQRRQLLLVGGYDTNSAGVQLFPETWEWRAQSGSSVGRPRHRLARPSMSPRTIRAAAASCCWARTCLGEDRRRPKSGNGTVRPGLSNPGLRSPSGCR